MRLAGLAAALAGALVGCTSPSAIKTETPTGGPVASATGEPSPGVSAAPLTSEELLAILPEDAGLPDFRGAEITAKYFVSLYDDIYSTGDLGVWEALALPTCEFCKSAAAGARDDAARGAIQSGGAVEVGDVADGRIDQASGNAVMKLRMQQGAGTTTYDDGTTTEYGGGEFDVFIELEFADGIWKVVGVDVERIEG